MTQTEVKAFIDSTFVCTTQTVAFKGLYVGDDVLLRFREGIVKVGTLTLYSLHDIRIFLTGKGVKPKAPMWQVHKTNASDGTKLGEVGNPHISKIIAESICTRCNEVADIGVQYIVELY